MHKTLSFWLVSHSCLWGCIFIHKTCFGFVSQCDETLQMVIYQVLGNWTCFPKWRNITILRLYLPGFPSFCDEAGSFLKVAKSESSLCDEVEHVCVNVYKRAPILTTVTTVCQVVCQWSCSPHVFLARYTTLPPLQTRWTVCCAPTTKEELHNGEYWSATFFLNPQRYRYPCA